MDKDKKMILGYIVGGLLVIAIVPSIIYVITSLLDNVFRMEVIRNSTIKGIIIILLLVIGLIYGIWSLIIQNTIGEGGPVDALFINSITAVVLVCAIFVFMLTVVVKMEEKRLLKDFGNQYEEYRKKVAMFIPWFQGKIK